MSITPAQSRALDATLDGKTDAEAATAAGVTPAKVRAWMKTRRWGEEFRVRLSRRAQRENGPKGSRTLGIETLREMCAPANGVTIPLEIRLQAAAHLAKLPADPPQQAPVAIPATPLDEAMARYLRLSSYLTMGSNAAAQVAIESQLRSSWLDIQAARVAVPEKPRSADEVLAELENAISTCPAVMLDHFREILDRRQGMASG